MVLYVVKNEIVNNYWVCFDNKVFRPKNLNELADVFVDYILETPEIFIDEPILIGLENYVRSFINYNRSQGLEMLAKRNSI